MNKSKTDSQVIDDLNKSVARKINDIKNSKRKISNSFENSNKKQVKIREWDLPKLETNGHIYMSTQKHKKRKINKTKSFNKPIVSKTIDDLFFKTFSKPSIYWRPKEPNLTQVVKTTLTNLVDLVVNSLNDADTTINESISNETKFNSLRQSLPLNTNDLKISCFDDGNMLVIFSKENKICCLLFDKINYNNIKSIDFRVNYLDININLCKFDNSFYISYNNTENSSSTIQVLDKDLNIKEEIVLNQMVSKLLGVNNDFIYFKPEISNLRIESRIYAFDRKTKIKKAIGQCNYPQRSFYFSKSLLQLELLNGKYICLDSDDSFKIIDEQSGVVLYSIKLQAVKQFVITPSKEIILFSLNKLSFFNLDGYLFRQINIDQNIEQSNKFLFNDGHNNVYLFDKNTFNLENY